MEEDQNIQYLSQEKYDQLKIETKKIKEESIPDIAKKIDEAKQLGDLSENAEYHAARDEMAWAQTRVKEIEHILRSSEVISTNKSISSGLVTIGSTVKVKSDKFEREFTIVGAQEADPLAGKISNESPLGSAFLGSKMGDIVEVKIPAGVQEYEILEIK